MGQSAVVSTGYGWCDRGFVMRAKSLGVHVILTEVDHLKAIEAAMDGFEVIPMKEAAEKVIFLLFLRAI